MSFLSITFAVCLALGVLIFHLAAVPRRPLVLLLLSMLYCCTWNPWHALLLLCTTAGVHRAALMIQDAGAERTKRRVAVAGVSILVLMLIVFKCALAAAAACNAVWFEANSDSLLWLAAPLGLSYYSFKLIGYLLDVYWEKMPAQRHFLSVALYASFFPQIVSGPIQRADDFFGQLAHLQRSDPADFVVGLRRILFGLFKKIVIADQLAVAVAQVHAHTMEHSSLELLIGAYGFSLQMYADFSGLTDIAIGIGLLFGIRGPENFNRPYFSSNLQDFWRRWHMSLTSWLTDYLFVPLRMSFRRLGDWGLALAIFVNMVAIGVWHGPKWTYLVFGCINGVFMIVSALTLKPRNGFFRSRPLLSRWRKLAAPLLTFHLVVFTHVFFQASDLHSALDYLGQLTHLSPHSAGGALRVDWSGFGVTPLRLGAALAGLAVMEWINWASSRPAWLNRVTLGRREVRWSLYYAAALLVILMAKGTTSFIYAKF